MLDQVHELLARLGLLEKAGEIRGSRQGILFLHATHLHAHMMRLLMGAFPKYGKEMYIVREEIKIPLN